MKIEKNKVKKDVKSSTKQKMLTLVFFLQGKCSNWLSRVVKLQKRQTAEDYDRITP